eukprot:11148539-Prorocentrum_lima.AAC.1
MTSSLVGSEMCIRDRARPSPAFVSRCAWRAPARAHRRGRTPGHRLGSCSCLLYTSDAADDM